MDIVGVSNSVSQVGFPIVCVMGLAFFIYKIWQRMSDQQERLTNTLVAVNETNRELSETNKALSETNAKIIDNLSRDVEKIKESIGV